MTKWRVKLDVQMTVDVAGESAADAEERAQRMIDNGDGPEPLNDCDWITADVVPGSTEPAR